MFVTCFSLRGVDVWMAGCGFAAPAEYATPPTTDVIATAATLVRTIRRDGRRQERNAMVTSSEYGNACESKLTPVRPVDRATARSAGESCVCSDGLHVTVAWH